MSFAARAFPHLARTEISLRKVTFSFLPPADLNEYKSAFSTKLFFNQEVNAMIYDATVRMLPIASSNPAVLALFENYANGLIEQLQKRRNVSSKAQVIIMKRIRDKNLNMNVVATELFMSPRTLQRRLDEEETSYQALIDKVRSELAQNYLQEMNLSALDTALLLGFSEPSAFVKSFKRWTGASPSQFKAVHARR